MPTQDTSTIRSIVIVNVWHDDNKGDGGIAEGVLRLIQQQHPQAQIGVVSMFPESAAANQSAHRHLIRSFPEITVVPSPFSSHDPSKSGGLARLFKKSWQVPLSLSRIALAPWLKHPAIQLIAGADLVIANGGQYLFTQKNYINSLFTAYRLLYPLLLARRCQIPYLLFSQSFGFYEQDRFDNQLIRTTLNDAVSTWAREDISYQKLLKLGLSEKKIALVPDAAFVLVPNHTERVQAVLDRHHLETGKFWTITVRQWSTYTEAFLDEMEVLIRAALQAGLIKKIVLVAHTQGPSQGGDDRVPTNALFHRFEGDEAVTMVDDDLTPGELVAFYKEAKLMIGTRFHSVIFALVGGTPAYAVSYAGPKTWGIMKMLGIDHLCSDMSDFVASEALERIKSADLNAIAAELPDKIAQLRQQLQENFEHLDMRV